LQITMGVPLMCVMHKGRKVRSACPLRTLHAARRPHAARAARLRSGPTGGSLGPRNNHNSIVNIFQQRAGGTGLHQPAAMPRVQRGAGGDHALQGPYGLCAPLRALRREGGVQVLGTGRTLCVELRAGGRVELRAASDHTRPFDSCLAPAGRGSGCVQRVPRRGAGRVRVRHAGMFMKRDVNTYEYIPKEARSLVGIWVSDAHKNHRAARAARRGIPLAPHELCDAGARVAVNELRVDRHRAGAHRRDLRGQCFDQYHRT
jgi:hypothetical protein